MLRLPRNPFMKKVVLGSAILWISGTVALVYFWQTGSLKRWIQARVVELYVNRVQPHLPFKIESIDANATWKELWEGRISKLSAVVRLDPFRIRLAGPIEILKPSKTSPYYEIKFLPVLTLEPTFNAQERSSEFEADLFIKATSDLSKLAALEAFIHADRFDWAGFSIKSVAPQIVADWHDNEASVNVGFKSSEWEPKKDSQIVKVGELSIEAKTPLFLKPFSFGPSASAQWRIKSGEMLWGDNYLNLPLEDFPGRLSVTFFSSDKKSMESIRSAQLEVGGKPGAAPLSFYLNQETPERFKLKWKAMPQSIPALVAGAQAATGSGAGVFSFLNSLNIFEFTSGTIQGEGQATINPRRLDPKQIDTQGVVRINEAALRIPGAKFAAKGIRADLPFSTRNGVQGELTVKDAWIRRLHGSLGTTPISLESLGPSAFSGEGFRLRVGSLRGNGVLPLNVDGLDLRVGVVQGKLIPGASKNKVLEVLSSVNLSSVPIEKILHPLCFLQGTRLPPATVEIALNPIRVSPQDIDPDGHVLVRLFEGTIRADEMGLFDMNSPTPEVDFDVELKGIQLGALGNWLGFGEMIGTLEGYARDVTIISWLPTHYDFSIDVKPYKRGWVELSPKALKNTISLFAAESMDEIPGIAQWLAFGPPSHWLGGYDIKYGGISLFSNDGVTLMESHDDPSIYYYTKQRYIFWGHRFKLPMPLGSHYPLVVDSTAMANLLKHMVNNLSALSAQKAAAEAKKGKTVQEITHEDFDCQPPPF